MEFNSTGYDIVAIPFKKLSEKGVESFPINDVNGTLSQSASTIRADRIVTLNPNTKQYTTYQYKPEGWVKAGEPEPTTDVITPETGVFFYKARMQGEVGKMVVAGSVISDPTYTVPLKKGLNLVASPYPTELAISSIQGDLSASTSPIRADKIMVMDPNTKAYTTYMLTPTGWIKNGESVPTTDKIPVNKGFFYQKAFKEGSITFTRPY